MPHGFFVCKICTNTCRSDIQFSQPPTDEELQLLDSFAAKNNNMCKLCQERDAKLMEDDAEGKLIFG